MNESLVRLISVAEGKLAADLILANCRIVNVFTGEITAGNIAIVDGKIAGIGDYHRAKTLLDLNGRYLAPGLIDGHTHVESSLLDIGEYARAVVPGGTLAIVSDLHEIANVCGLNGIKHIINRTRLLPLDFFLMAPSCVPASHPGTPGAELDSEAIRRIVRWQSCIGLGELMDFPAVLAGDPKVLSKIELAAGKPVDGHAPALSGKHLNAYIASGIYSDHESVSPHEAREKLERGMWLMIREGSSEKNLETLLPLVNDKTFRRCFFVVDDRNCAELLRDGDIDAVVRKAIQLGLDPVRAVQMASLNTAEYFHLKRLGAIAPGYWANLVVLSDLYNFTVKKVFYRGRMVAEEGKALFQPGRHDDSQLIATMKIKPFKVAAFRLPASANTYPVIEVVPGQIITRKKRLRVKVTDGFIVPDIERDILKLVVVERHHATGNIGRGLVRGFGLKAGALASSIAHDAHNIIAIGTTDTAIFSAVKEIERLGGGLVVATDDGVLTSLNLPIAGILSGEPLPGVVHQLEEIERKARELGTKLDSPFATLSFLTLPVIPELRLTDLGLFDVNAGKLIEHK